MAQKDFAVFIDRDGTINVDIDFLISPSQIQLIPRSAEAIRDLNDLHVPVIVITNQSGVARGLLSEDDLHSIHRRMDEMLNPFGATIQDYYHCPHHPTEGIDRYKKECDCRKPKPGMLTDAQKKYGLDLKHSYVIGDKSVDMKAGKSVGATTIQVATGYGTDEKDQGAGFRDHYAADLYDAVQIIKSTLNQ